MSAAAALCLGYGGLTFCVRAPDARLADDLDSVYLPFVLPATAASGAASAPASTDGDAPIAVTLRRGSAPEAPGADALFETGGAWTMRANGAHRLFAHPGVGGATPPWTACFPTSAESVTVWYPDGVAASSGPEAALTVPLQYPFDQILLMYALARVGGLLTHATGVVLEGRSVVCFGVSGGGKSTLARQFLAAQVGDVLSDDRIVLRTEALAESAAGQTPGLRAYGTPWPGDARIAENRSAPVGALVFLRHGPHNRLTGLTGHEALQRLMKVASLPWFDAAVLAAALDHCTAILAAVPVYELEFLPEPAAALLLRDLAASLGPAHH